MNSYLHYLHQQLRVMCLEIYNAKFHFYFAYKEYKKIQVRYMCYLQFYFLFYHL